MSGERSSDDRPKSRLVRNHPGMVFAVLPVTKDMRYLLLLLLIWLTGCSSRDRGVVVERIPGTELTATEPYSFTISPDEQWLTFLEWIMPRSRFSKEGRSAYRYHIVSLNLKTGERTEHSVESIPEGSIWASSRRIEWKYKAWRSVVDRFRSSGWNSGVFYFEPRARSRDLALDPRKPAIHFATRPEIRTCSDCPPRVAWDRAPYARFLWNLYEPASNEVSAVLRGGLIHSIYYKGERPHRTRMILHLSEDGEREVIVERPRKTGTLITIVSVRVSPNERYLAYGLHSKKQEFLSGPRQEIFVLDLNTREEKKVGTHSSVSNLIWSPDSKRLYFAGGAYDDYRGIYVVDVAATFSP